MAAARRSAPLFHSVTSWTVRALLNEVVTGNLAAASFARPSPWTEADALGLVEALAASRPVGALTLAEPHSCRMAWEATPVGGSEIPKAGTARWLVVDGARRLAMLAALLTPAGGTEGAGAAIQRTHLDIWCCTRGDLPLRHAARPAPRVSTEGRQAEFLALAFPLVATHEPGDWLTGCELFWGGLPPAASSEAAEALRIFRDSIVPTILGLEIPVHRLHRDTSPEEARLIRFGLNGGCRQAG